MHYALLYEVPPDYVARRTPFRPAHLKLVSDAYARGELVMAGALGDPADGAMLVFRFEGAAERFAAADPYVLNGAVVSWKVRKWNTVVGDGAVMPVVGEQQVEVPGLPSPGEYRMGAYVDLVEGGDVVRAFTTQTADVLSYFRGLSESQAAFRYGPGKWSVKEVLGHITDTERVFSYRAVCLARGEKQPLPGFDQDEYMAGAAFGSCSMASLLEEFRTVREATIAMYASLSAEAWTRRGTVSNYSATVRGLAFTSAGHERHHMKILRERYFSV